MDSKLPVSSNRARFRYFLSIPTRWSDQDSFGHVNNAVYYVWFDTAITFYLKEVVGYDLADAQIINVTAETMCQFKRSVVFPQVVEAGINVETLGRSSVRYNLGLFVKGEEALCAVGHVVDVFVHRDTMRATDIPDKVRSHLSDLLITTDARPLAMTHG